MANSSVMYGNYESLEVWQLAHKLVKEIYIVTKDFSPDERFGLTSQIRRSAVSIPNNLAEGSMRLNAGDFRKFVSIARGSCGETQYLLLLSYDLKYITKQRQLELSEYCVRIGKMLTKLYQSLN